MGQIKFKWRAHHLNIGFIVSRTAIYIDARGTINMRWLKLSLVEKNARMNCRERGPRAWDVYLTMRTSRIGTIKVKQERVANTRIVTNEGKKSTWKESGHDGENFYERIYSVFVRKWLFWYLILVTRKYLYTIKSIRFRIYNFGLIFCDY